MHNGCTSPAHPRAAVYIRKNAVLPVTGSGGGSGAFSAVFCGASEQAENIMAMETIVKKKRGFILDFAASSFQCTALEWKATREVRS